MTTQTPYEQRLDRIETKLDQLNETMTAVVRVEEQMAASTKRSDRLEYRLDTLENEIDKLKTNAASNFQSIRSTERFFWIVITGVVSAAVYMVT